MKKLLIATDYFLPRWDGVSRFLLEIIPIIKEEYEITLVAPCFNPEFDLSKIFPGVKIITFPIIKLNFGDIQFSGFHYWKIKKLVKESDLVFAQSIGPISMSAISASKRLKKPVISYAHSIDWELATRSIKRFKYLVNILTKIVARFFYNKCTLLMMPSIDTENLYDKNKILVRKEIVPLGINLEVFKPCNDKDQAKKKIGIDPNLTVIGFTGRIGREKDLFTLYRAFRRLEKKHKDVRLLIVGSGVKELIEIFSSERNIILPGFVNNIVDYLAAMDIYAMTSLTETTSLATMEAMACGLPIVTTRVGLMKDYIKEKENGMFIPFKNSLVLSMKLEQLLDDVDLRKKLGYNARETIECHLKWSITARKIIEIFRKYAY